MKSEKTKPSTWAVAVIGGSVIIGFIAFAIRPMSQAELRQDIDRAAIPECWKGYERKSLDEDTKRFVAKACESMEESYIQRYRSKP